MRWQQGLTVSRVQLDAVRASLVENVGSVTPCLDQVVNLGDRKRAGLGKGHAAERRTLHIRRRDRVLVDILRDLTTAVGRLADYERAVGFRGGNDRLEGLDGVPRRLCVNDGVLLRLEVGPRDGQVAQDDHANLALSANIRISLCCSEDRHLASSWLVSFAEAFPFGGVPRVVRTAKPTFPHSS